MKQVLNAMLIGVVFLISSCTRDRITGGGSVITENRSVKNFTRVGLSGSSNVTVMKGDVYNVTVTGYSNLLPYFETNVVNGSLEVGFREHLDVRHSNIDVTVTVPVLNGLDIAGSGNITSTGNFTNNQDFATNIAGSGNISLHRGSATNFSASIIGSGNVNAFDFTAEKATVQVAGSGDTRLYANDKLLVKIDGSGSVYYKGTPTVSATINGSGKVVKQ